MEDNDDEQSIELSVLFSLTDIAFCLVDSIKNQVIDIQQYKLGIHLSFNEAFKRFKTILKDNGLHLKRYESIRIIHNNSDCAFVPRSLFKKELLAEYLRYQIPLYKNDVISYDEIINTSLVNVFKPYAQLNDYSKEVLSKLGKVSYIHYNTALIKSIFAQKVKEEQGIFIDFDASNLRIIVTKKEDLLFYNTFTFEDDTTFLYYILWVFNELKIDRNDAIVHIIGDFIDLENNPYLTLLDEYVQEIKILATDTLPSKIHSSIDRRQLTNKTLFF